LKPRLLPQPVPLRIRLKKDAPPRSPIAGPLPDSPSSVELLQPKQNQSLKWLRHVPSRRHFLQLREQRLGLRLVTRPGQGFAEEAQEDGLSSNHLDRPLRRGNRFLESSLC